MSGSLTVVDLSPFADGSGPSAAADEMARLFDVSCRHTGFVLVTGHGVAAATQARMLDRARAFFATSTDAKQAIAIGRSSCHRGYVAMASETLDADASGGDLKETLDTGNEDPIDHPEVLAGTPLHGANQLPDVDGFVDAFRAYRAEAIGAAERTMRVMAMALDLDPEFFLSLGETLYNLRFVHYPPKRTLAPVAGQLGCGTHTDYGSVTVLADDGIGGLQVMRRDGVWIDVLVPDELMVVNLGDLMSIWTNDRWVSNPHRVVNPPESDRYSMPLFVTPPYRARIAVLPSCVASGESDRYEPVEAGPYLLSRFDATHSYRNPLLEAHNRGADPA